MAASSIVVPLPLATFSVPKPHELQTSAYECFNNVMDPHKIHDLIAPDTL